MKAPDCVIQTKGELLKFLQDRLNYFINEERNPFLEVRMVSYINAGIDRLMKIEVDDDTLIKMYDENDTIQFEVES